MKKKSPLTLAVVTAVVFLAVIIAGLLLFQGCGFTIQETPQKGVVRVVTAQQLVAEYQWFYDQKSVIDAQRVNWQNARRQKLPEASSMLMVLNSQIGEYNSRSKQTTRNQWKAEDLPYQIEMEVTE